MVAYTLDGLDSARPAMRRLDMTVPPKGKK
jgi:hypothetical protein